MSGRPNNTHVTKQLKAYDDVILGDSDGHVGLIVTLEQLSDQLKGVQEELLRLRTRLLKVASGDST